MVYKNFFAPNSPTFWVKQAENREEHMQLQSVTRFTQKQYIVGPYYADPEWRYFLCYGAKRAGVTNLPMRV